MFGSTLSRLCTCTTGGLLLLQLACGSISSKSFGDGSGGNGGAALGGSSAGGGGGGATGGSAGGAGGGIAAGGAAGGSLAGAGGSGAAGAGGTPGGGSQGGTAGAAAGGAAGGGGAKATGGAGGAAGGSTGAGGAAGAGGSGPTCASLETDYTNAVNGAKSCTTSGTCAVKISKTICGCSGCPSSTYISDATGPNAVKSQWQQLGCKCPSILCIACLNEPTSATCDSILLTAAAPIGGGGIIALPRSCTDH